MVFFSDDEKYAQKYLYQKVEIKYEIIIRKPILIINILRALSIK